MNQPTIPQSIRGESSIAALMPALIVIAAMPSLSGGCTSRLVLRPADPDVRIVALGDSATRGPAREDYPALLAELLGIPAGAVANEGVPGETTDMGLRRLNGLIDRAIFPNADVLIYWQGGTDVVDFVEARDSELRFLGDNLDPQLRAEFDAELNQIWENIAAAVAQARAAGWTVYLVTYYPLAAGVRCPLVALDELRPEEATVLDGYLEELNERIRAVAADGAATLVDAADVGETLLNDPANYLDCNHLSASGNAQVAELVAAAIGS